MPVVLEVLAGISMHPHTSTCILICTQALHDLMNKKKREYDLLQMEEHLRVACVGCECASSVCMAVSGGIFVIPSRWYSFDVCWSVQWKRERDGCF